MTNRFVSPSGPPAPHQREAAECLIEECAEVIEGALILAASKVQKRGTKLLRFGVEEVQPGQSLTNVERLSREVGDLLEVIDLGIAAQILVPHQIAIGRAGKKGQLGTYLQNDVPPAEPALPGGVITGQSWGQVGFPISQVVGDDVTARATDILAGVLMRDWLGTEADCLALAARLVDALQENDYVRLAPASE